MIEMIAGVFGLPIKNKNNEVVRVEGKGPNDGPFSTTPEREAELVRSGVARYVEESTGTTAYDSMDEIAPIGFDETPPVPESADEIPEYSEAMKASELRTLGAMFGLSFKVGMSKKQMVEALDDYFDLSDAVEPMEDGELAPSFDAAEAVQ